MTTTKRSTELKEAHEAELTAYVKVADATRKLREYKQASDIKLNTIRDDIADCNEELNAMWLDVRTTIQRMEQEIIDLEGDFLEARRKCVRVFRQAKKEIVESDPFEGPS